MMIRYASLFVLVTLMNTPAWANTKYNDCARLHIQIGNGSNIACRLVASTLKHGKLISSPPAMIPSGYSDRFDISQTFRGPDVVLEYQCGDNRIVLASQQNYCFLEAGQVHASVTTRRGNLSAHYTLENGSYYWGKPGLINWIIY